MVIFEERPEFKNYVVPKLTKSKPVYSWYVFPHSFSQELIEELIKELGIKSTDVCYDPFVGAGTTLLACRQKSIPAFGIDELPFSAFVTNAKLCDYEGQVLTSTLDAFIPCEVNECVFGSIPLIEEAFSREVKLQISSIYQAILNLHGNQRNFFLLALLAILEDVSNTVKSGGWVKLENHSIDPNIVLSLFKDQARKMIEDVLGLSWSKNEGRWYASIGDARTYSENKYSFVITSPPYLNRHDYTRVFALEMALHFVRTNKDLIDIRYKALRSHVEAKPPSAALEQVIPLPQTVIDIVEEVKNRCSRNDKKRVPGMIQGYFEDMYLTLKNLYNNIEPEGKVAFVVGNVRFKGVMIAVDEILWEIGHMVGLTPLKIIVARYRGNSAQQMASYGREPSRESVVIWQKVCKVQNHNALKG